MKSSKTSEDCKKLYWLLIKKFKIECNEILKDSKITDNEKEEKILKLAQKFNSEYEEKGCYTGFISVENFGGLARRFIAEKKQSFIVKEENIKSLAKIGVHVDRSLNLATNLQIMGSFNYRVKWIHDVFYQKCHEWIEKNRKDSNAVGKIQGNELIPILEDKQISTKLFSSLPKIVFTDKEFRDITGLKRLTGKQIKDLVEDYSSLIVKGPLAYRCDYGDKKWKYYSISGSICTAITEESGEFSTYPKKPKFKHFFIWHPAGFLLFYNLLKGEFTLFDKDFYKLSRQEQEIYRKVAQHSSSSFSLPQIGIILGYKKEAKNIKQQIPTFKKYLSNLKKKKLIYSYRVKGRGKNTIFHVFRLKLKKKLTS